MLLHLCIFSVHYMQALVKDGYNADEYIFDGKIKDETICQERDSESNVSTTLLIFLLLNFV